jgi:hypothetical protein
MGGTAVKKLLALALFALLVAGLVACGGGSDDSSSTQSTQAGSSQSTSSTPSRDDNRANEKQAGDDKGGSGGGGDDSAGDDSGSGGSSDDASAEFRTPGGDNSIQNYGEEADSAELANAEEAIVAYLGARAKADWAKSCEYLAKTAREPVEKLAESSPQLKGKSCGAIIAALSTGLPKAALASPVVEGIAAVRFKGDRGFALFHGPKGVNFFISLVKEDGQWKVGSLGASEFP